MESPNQLKFGFIIGAENMHNDPILGPNGQNQLSTMHNVEKGLSERWMQSESITGKRFISYIYDQDDQVVSMISGIIKKDGNLYVINTATLPDNQRKGLITGCVANLINNIKENNYVKAIHVLKMSNLSHEKHNLDPKFLDKVNEASRNIKETDPRWNNKLDPSMAKSVQAIENVAEDDLKKSGIHPHSTYVSDFDEKNLAWKNALQGKQSETPIIKEDSNHNFINDPEEVKPLENFTNRLQFIKAFEKNFTATPENYQKFLIFEGLVKKITNLLPEKGALITPDICHGATSLNFTPFVKKNSYSNPELNLLFQEIIKQIKENGEFKAGKQISGMLK